MPRNKLASSDAPSFRVSILVNPRLHPGSSFTSMRARSTMLCSVACATAPSNCVSPPAAC